MKQEYEGSKSNEPESILCHNCLADNPEAAHFCHSCRTPLSSFAAIDPFMSIAATCDTYAKATSGRPSVMKTLGMLSIFGTASLCSFYSLYVLATNAQRDFLTLKTESWIELVPYMLRDLFLIFWLLLPLAYVIKILWRFFCHGNKS